MSDPLTLILGGSAIGLNLLGNVSQGRAQKKASEFEATIELARGREEGRRIRRAGDFQQGEIRANIGKSGVQLTGSAKLALFESIRVNEADALQAELNSRNRSAAIRAGGSAAQAGSILSGVGGALSAGASFFI